MKKQTMAAAVMMVATAAMVAGPAVAQSRRSAARAERTVDQNKRIVKAMLEYNETIEGTTYKQQVDFFKDGCRIRIKQSKDPKRGREKHRVYAFDLADADLSNPPRTCTSGARTGTASACKATGPASMATWAMAGTSTSMISALRSNRSAPRADVAHSTACAT